MFELDAVQEFDAAHEVEFFGALPQQPAVFLIELRGAAENGARPYLARTANLQRRLGVLLGRTHAPTRRLNLRELAARVRYRLVGSRFEQALVLYHHAVRIHPARYRSWMRLRPPVLVKLKLRSAYPRAYVTRRILDDAALYLGPFASRRAADAFLSQALNFFKIRRCQIRIQRDPKFPGCLYSEMKMCLAPCFAGCTDEEYGAEVVRVDSFLRTRGGSLAAELGVERDGSSAALDFERSAAVQKKIEKVSAALRLLPELAHNLDELDAVVLQRGCAPQSIQVFPVRLGFLEPPMLLEFGSLAAEPRSVEAILRERLEAGGVPEPPGGAAGLDRRADYLALLAQWYYSKPRDGEILYAEPAGGSPPAVAGWPYRRIVRACSRLLASETAQE